MFNFVLLKIKFVKFFTIMKSKFIIFLAIVIFLGLTFLLSFAIEKMKTQPKVKTSKQKSSENKLEKSEKTSSGAMESMQFISQIRAYPDADIPADKFFKAFEYSKNSLQSLNENDILNLNEWQSIGPNNIGGRSLCVAIHPVDTGLIFLGSSSGGLWKSNTGGIGADAWRLVNTGFPSSAVSSIAIDSVDPNIMYIGTGENYGYQFSENGLDVRVTRGMYGIGILKTTDGGNSWAKSLDWSYENKRGVWKVLINPKNSNVLYAATSEGIYKSVNAGSVWTQVANYKMVMDLKLNRSDTSVLYASVGNLTNNVPLTDKGIFKSTNGGLNWSKLSGGLPASWSGKATLEIYDGNQNFIYASIANDFSYVGYYKSTNAGLNWVSVNTSIPIGNQGWYNNGHLVKTNDPNSILVGTLDVEKSINGGSTFTTMSDWSAWNEGATPPGDPEGPPNFVHADVHYFESNPKDPDKIYITADGGLYRSNNFGETFYSCNGGFVTSQFYATFANSFQDSTFCLGGLQDNRAAFYQGTTAWFKTFFGDGMSCAINSQNDQICYTEYTNGSINKSTNGGLDWFNASPPGAGSANYCFVAPFICTHSDPETMFAGARAIYKSVNGGDSWTGPYGSSVFNNAKILSIASSFTSDDTVYAGTVSGTVFRSVNSGLNWTNISGTSFPNRYVTDLTVNDNKSNEVYATCGGFGSGHVFKTTNAGNNWTDISGNLPDVPVHSVIVDPDYNQNVYIGSDLGVYVTTNGGSNWFEYRTGMPYALVFDVTIVYPNRKLRVATYGNGIYERKLLENPVGISNFEVENAADFELSQNYPNPFNPKTVIQFNIPDNNKSNLVKLTVYNSAGSELTKLINENKSAGKYTVTFDGSNYPSGVYFYKLESGRFVSTKKMILIR